VVCGLWFLWFLWFVVPRRTSGAPRGGFHPQAEQPGPPVPAGHHRHPLRRGGIMKMIAFLCETLAAFSFKSQRVKMFRDLAIIISKNHCRQEVILENRCTRILEIHSDCHSRHGVTISNATVSIYPYLREGVGEVNRQVGSRVHLHLGCEPP